MSLNVTNNTEASMAGVHAVTTGTLPATSTSEQFYVTGGTLPSDAPSYVIRQADTDLYNSLTEGEFCYVLNTRQMGKSSLMIRTANRLRAEQSAVAILDLTAVGQNLSAEQWYDGMLTLLGDQLGADLEDRLEEFWQANDRLGPMQRWMEAIRQVALPALRDRFRSLVIFVDEIDAVRSLPFSADEFFAGIRECYNRRTQDSEFQRLTFCLLGVATPADLVMESRMSPFNIGRRVVVTDFTALEAAPLATGLPGASAMLERVLYWTGGHPYLTQRICKALSHASSEIAANTDIDKSYQRIVDQLCEELFLSKSARETDDNLAFVQNRMLKSEVDLAAMLDLYNDVAIGKRVVDDETNTVIPVLRLSGVVRVEDGVLRVRNRIYAQVFNSDWVVAHMPHAELRRQRIAYRQGLVRAALVSAVVIVIVGILAVAAAWNAHKAYTLSRQAVLAQRESELHEKDALIETRIAIAAQQTADRNARQASKSALDARLEAGRADTKEREVLAADRQIKELAQQRKVALDDRQMALASAIGARQKAKTEAENSNRLLYIANMNLAQQAYDNNNISRVLDLLSESDAGPKHAFEWGYWQRECHLDLQTLRGHRGKLTAVLYLQDGRHVVTASVDKTVRVWDSLTGRQVPGPQLQGNETITSLALSGDSNVLAVGSADETVQLFDARYFRPIRTVETHGWPVDAVALNHDASRLIAVGGDHRSIATLTEWDTRSGGELHSLRMKFPTFTCVAFSPDGRMVAAGGPDRQVHIWNTASWQEIHRLTGHKGEVMCIAFSPDGKSLASGAYDNTAHIWDLEEESSITLTGHLQPVGGIAYSSDGAWVATAGYDNVARIWDSTTGQALLTLKGHTDPVTAVAFSPDGSRLITGSSDDTARIWESTRRRDTLTLRGHTGSVQDIAISPDGNHIISASMDGTVRSWNTLTGRLNGRLIPQNAITSKSSGTTPVFTSVAYSSDGKFIAAGTMDGSIRVVDGESHQLTQNVQIGRLQVSAIAFLPGTHLLCVSIGAADVVRGTGLFLVDVTNGTIKKTLRSGGPMTTSLAYNANGTMLATGTIDNMIHMWNGLDGSLIREWTVAPTEEGQLHSFVTALCFSPDGTRLGSAEGDKTGSGDNTARVWDSATGKLTLILKGHANSLYSIAFSPDGSRIVTGSADKTARVWDTVTGREVLTLKGHDNVVLKCLFTPDGNRIITCSVDATIKVWERAPDDIAGSRRENLQSLNLSAPFANSVRAQHHFTRQ